MLMNFFGKKKLNRIVDDTANEHKLKTWIRQSWGRFVWSGEHTREKKKMTATKFSRTNVQRPTVLCLSFSKLKLIDAGLLRTAFIYDSQPDQLDAAAKVFFYFIFF